MARLRYPQTLRKIERFWGILWRECLETANARARNGHFIDWYNFQRIHSGIDGLVPADRYFHTAPRCAHTQGASDRQRGWNLCTRVYPDRHST